MSKLVVEYEVTAEATVTKAPTSNTETADGGEQEVTP